MKRLNLSTKMKAAVGYAAVIALFLAAVWLIVGVLDSLTRTDGAERTINNRQRATNDVVSRLYQAEVIGQALAEAFQAGTLSRDEIFVVSKVYPHHASRTGVAAACDRSRRRLGLDRIDLYLLHWPGSHPVA